MGGGAIGVVDQILAVHVSLSRNELVLLSRGIILASIFHSPLLIVDFFVSQSELFLFKSCGITLSSLVLG